ncbi:MAG: membrane protein insertase YidC [Xanthomonadales bacterium]|nr:membrane protein insertase YidC [Xanthomonadales bacterium]
MQNFRPLLFIAWLLGAYLLWQAWNDFNAPPPSPAPAASAGVLDDGALPVDPTVPMAPAAPASDTPLAPAAMSAVPTPAAETPAAAASRRVTVETDVLRLVIDARGGTIVKAELLAYPQTLRSSQPVELLSDDPARLFHAQTGLVSANGPAPDHTALWEIERDRYAMQGDHVTVPLTWRGDNGLVITKLFVLRRGDYAVEVRHEIRNEGSEPWTGSVYRQLQRVPMRTSTGFSFTDATAITFHGAAWYSPEERFEKRQFDDFAGKPLNRTVTGGWTGLLQHYFFAAWIPDTAQANDFSTQPVPPNRFLIRQVAAAASVPPGGEHVDSARLWVGPKLQNVLPEVAPGLELTVDYGIFTFLAKPLFWALDKFYRLVGNWGLAIILVTLLIKLLFYKLSEAQYRSMAKMRKLQPRLVQLKERYGDDRQKMNMAMMELYKKEKINPLGGCLPILLQIPVFIALYWVLLESVELRQAPFFLWIQDLSARDPYFVLPVLNGLTMWLTQKLSPSPGMDPIQKRIFQIMPIMFSVMFAFFPAGLVLYWTTNGALGLLQQWVITKRIEAKPA